MHELFEDSVQDLDLELVGHLKNFDVLAADESKAETTTGALSGSGEAVASASGSSTPAMAVGVSLGVVGLVLASIGVAYFIGRRDGRFTSTPDYHETETKDDVFPVKAFPIQSSESSVSCIDNKSARVVEKDVKTGIDDDDDEIARATKKDVYIIDDDKIQLKNNGVFTSCLKFWAD